MPDPNDDRIDPGSGRISMAGANSLQRSVDTLDRTINRLLSVAGSGGFGGGRGGPPAVMTGSPPPAGRGGSAVMLRGERFPEPVSWGNNGGRHNALPPGPSAAGPSTSYQWGTPEGNTPRGPFAMPPPRQLNGGVSPPAPPAGPAGAALSGQAANTRNLAAGAYAARSVGKWGSAMAKTGSVMDTYSQWAAIGAGSPEGPDGTTGRSVNAIRKNMFGSENQNLTMWSHGAKDAQQAAFTASRQSGFSELTPGSNAQINPQFTGYMQNVKDLAMLNPTMDASSMAGTVGKMASNKGLYASMMYGYKPMLGEGGKVDRNAMGSFTDSVMQRTFKGKKSIAPEQLKASLGQGGSLHANIGAYVQSVGGDEEMQRSLEDYMTGRNTAAQRGMGGKDFDKLLKDFTGGGKAGEKAEGKLRKIGITDSMLQHQKDSDATKTGNISDLMDSLGPAVKDATDALRSFHEVINGIVNTPGIKQAVGTGAGWGSVFGPAISGGLGAAAGMRMGTGAFGALGAAAGLGAGRRGGAGLLTRLRGAGPLARGGALGLAGAGVGVAGHAAVDSATEEGSGWQKAGDIGVGAGSGALVGAGIGSIVPGVGTGIGAAVGGVIGGAASAWNAFSSDHKTGNDGVGGGAEGGKSSTASSKSGSAISGKKAAGAISAAVSQVGKPYIWGGVGPNGFDCSGLMQWSYRKIGVRLPRVSQQQMKVGKSVSRKNVRPGDLMFPHSGHVVMYIGNNKIVEAPRPGKKIRVGPVSTYGKYAAIRRIVGAVGNYSGSEKEEQEEQGDSSKGDSGSNIIAGEYGSIEESDAISAVMASVSGTLLNSSMKDNSEKADGDDTEASGPTNPKGNAALGKKMAAAKGWSGGQWKALYQLWQHESGWRHKADNPSSDAYGIPQALPGSKMASAGRDWKSNPGTQIKWGLKYIQSRYGTPQKAWNFWNNRNPHWYDKGAWEIDRDQEAVVHKGEMIIERPKADTIRNALMRDVTTTRDPSRATGARGGSGPGVHLNFHSGSLQFVVNGAMSSSDAKSAANDFVTALRGDDRIRQLSVGL